MEGRSVFALLEDSRHAELLPIRRLILLLEVDQRFRYRDVLRCLQAHDLVEVVHRNVTSRPIYQTGKAPAFHVSRLAETCLVRWLPWLESILARVELG